MKKQNATKMLYRNMMYVNGRKNLETHVVNGENNVMIRHGAHDAVL